MSSRELLDAQLETILLKETARLHERAAVMPLELEDVRKLSLLIEINDKRTDKRPSDDSLVRPKGTYSLEDLLQAMENGRRRQEDSGRTETIKAADPTDPNNEHNSGSSPS